MAREPNATSIAKQAISTVESLGSVQPQTVRVELDVTEPTITNAIADEAKTTLETLVNNAVAIKVRIKTSHRECVHAGFGHAHRRQPAVKAERQ